MNLQIEIDNGSGFCFGVTTAIRKAEEELAKGNKLYCLGDIVHNGMEVERLHEQGLITIDHEQLRTLHDAKVLLRAHGEPPETYEIARQNNIEIIDATCPVVLALQSRIKRKWSDSPTAQTAAFKSFDPICRQVANRMPHIAEFAAQHDVILFVSGRKSSNGHALFTRCKEVNANSHLIEREEEIDFSWFQGAKTVGICGATSTPKWLMEECRDAILRY